MINKSAPRFDPEKWAPATSDIQLWKDYDGFFKQNNLCTPGLTLPTLVELMGFFERVSQPGSVPDDDPDLIAKHYLKLSFEKAVELNKILEPHFEGPFYRSSCYAYSLDHTGPREIFARFDPGAVSGFQIDWLYLQKEGSSKDFRCAIHEGCSSDSLEYIGKNIRYEEGAYLIACFLGFDSFTRAKDVHFVRQDYDGGFSHKASIFEAVSRKDFQNLTIQEPKTAVFKSDNLSYEFEGYFLAPAVK